MFAFRRLCFVSSTQRCIDSGTDDADAARAEVSSSADSKLGFVPKYAELEEATMGSYLKLTLTVVETEHMTLGDQFEITPKGLKNSLRKVTGGKTFGGSQQPEGDVVLNDILLPEQERGVGKQHFVLEYNSSARSYRLRDLNEGTGTFIRLDQPLVLTKACIVSFGESHVSLSLDGPSDNPDLKISVIEGVKKDEKL